MRTIQKQFSWVLLLLLVVGTVGCGESPEAEVTEEESQEPTSSEVKLGDYRFRSFDPSSNTQTRYTFTLAGMATDEQVEELEQEIEAKSIRLRDRIMIVSRESTVTELEDPNLHMFRRRLLKEINRVLEKGPLDDILVSHYRVKTR